MKFAMRSVVTAALLLACAAASANAQVVDQLTFKTDFPFIAGNTRLPAGTYTLSPLDGESNVLELSNGQLTVLLETNADSPRRAPSKDEVTFNKYGNTYVLHGIYDVASEGGAVVIASRAEARHAKAHGTPTQQTLPATKSSKL